MYNNLDFLADFVYLLIKMVKVKTMYCVNAVRFQIASSSRTL